MKKGGFNLSAVNDSAYEKFKEVTGLQVSRRTFYRMKREIQSGEGNRLARIIDNAEVPIPERSRAKRQRDIDSRPFVAYDGEGRTLEGKHRYVLLACSNGESLYRPRGISTVEGLDFLLRTRRTKCIRIFYSFGYDVQQLLVDLSDDQLVRAMHGQPVKYRGYTIQYLHGKIFTVNNVRFYDVFNYWQTSFIKACYLTLGKDKVPEDLIRGKEDRSNFAEWSIDDILRYTNIELDLLVQLAEHLRSVLLRADIHLGTAFYGPGSIANYWFKHHSISPRQITDPTLTDVMERAYYGGRFETFTLGRIDPVYECDINSAYPAVLSELPYLDEWEKWSGSLFDRSSDYSVWHVSWKLPEGSKIGPFPSRDRHGLITFPANGIGWYWKPEVEAAIALYGTTAIQIREGYNPSVVDGEPFSWVKDVYDRRLELKAKDDPAQWALKVGLNSLYGKAAQRVGSAKYFSLAWAGYITSATRAKLLRATIGRTESVIAFATDAVYFNKRPNLADSNALGGWGIKRWNRGYFIQSGVYRLEGNQEHKDAYRGFSVKNGIQDLIDQINENPFKHPSIYQTKFVGHLEAIRAPNKLGPHRLCFIVMRKKLQPYKTTKRRVDNSDLFNTVDEIWFDSDDERDAFLIERGSDYTLGRYEGEPKKYRVFVWNSYHKLLKGPIETKILENHNDHRSFTHHEIGELEESYPFKPLADRNDDLSMADSEGIAEERIGGAAGIIDISKIGNLPVVDESEILQELHT